MTFISRRQLLKTTAAAAATGQFVKKTAAEKTKPVAERAQQRPSILLFTLDDCDAGSIGCFGNHLHDVTPNIDRLAKEGVRFSEAYTNSATCQPSRLSLMSGQQPETTKTWGHSDPLPEATPTLSSVLRKDGYFTAIIGKQPHHQPESAFKWTRSRGPNGKDLTADTWDNREDGYQSLWRSPEGLYGGTRELVMQAKQARAPFLLNVNTSDPHRPWPGSIDEPMFLEHMRRNPSLLDEIDLAQALRPIRPFSKNYSPFEVPVPGYLPDLPGVRVDLAQYYSSLHNGDRAFGRILDALRDEGVLDSTVIVVLSDQGASFPMSKQNLYPHGTNLGLIVKWPGVTIAGAVEKRMISIVDIMPTILELLSIDLPAGLDGRSFAGLFTDRGWQSRDSLFAQYNFARPGAQVFPMRSVRSGNFFYVFNGWHNEKRRDINAPITYDGRMDPLIGLCWMSMKQETLRNAELKKRVDFIRLRVRDELYDLSNDPFCMNNLAADPLHSSHMRELKSLLERHMSESSDPLLSKFLGTGPLPEEWMVLAKAPEKKAD